LIFLEREVHAGKATLPPLSLLVEVTPLKGEKEIYITNKTVHTTVYQYGYSHKY
jgi:hypothetical protein